MGERDKTSKLSNKKSEDLTTRIRGTMMSSSRQKKKTRHELQHLTKGANVDGRPGLTKLVSQFFHQAHSFMIISGLEFEVELESARVSYSYPWKAFSPEIGATTKSCFVTCNNFASITVHNNQLTV